MDSQKTEIEGLKAIVAHLEGRESPTCLDSSCASDKFDDLEFRVAIGKVYPTRDATLHGSSMFEGHIKVQVDTVEDAYKAIPLPKQTDKAQNLEQSILEFIEWPRKKIKERILKRKPKNDQTKHGMEKTKSIRSQSQSKSKVSHMKKIQLEGLKLPNPKLYYKS
ncbi:hypothetical protein Tco_1280318 [Tanacetum coccineum]